MSKSIAIIVDNQQKGLFIGIAHVLQIQYGFKTKLIARDNYIKKIIERLLPNKQNIYVFSEIKIDKYKDNIIDYALKIEKKYDINLSLLLSEDRGFGQGYLSNVEKHPDIIRASWSHEEKLLNAINEIKRYEVILKDVDFVIGYFPLKKIQIISSYYKIKYLCPWGIRYGDRFHWSDDVYVTSEKFIKRIKNNLLQFNDKEENNIPLEIEGGANKKTKNLKFTYFNALKGAANHSLRNIKTLLLNKQKRNSYRYFGWVPSYFRNVSNFKYIKSIGKFPEDLKRYKFIFFPLHLEPEIALLGVSPEFGNSIEAITWISKSLPADTMIVVKENMLSFGVRSRWYYRQINKIGNAVWSHPNAHSWDWIKKSEAVATITGTVGVEAVYLKKPVISYGKHQIINHLPTVSYVTNFKETKSTINNILSKNYNKRDLDKSKYALSKAQLESSFDFPEYKYSSLSSRLEKEIAEKALGYLFKEYPELSN